MEFHTKKIELPFPKVSSKYLVFNIMHHTFFIEESISFLWSLNNNGRKFLRKQYEAMKRSY